MIGVSVAKAFTKSAGNLAATELQAATVEMEKRIKGGPKKISAPEQLDQKFVELEKAIFRALQAVQILGPPAEDKPAASSSAELSAVPPELIKEMISRFSTETSLVLGYGAYKKIKGSFLNKLIRFETMLTALQYFSYAIDGKAYMGVGQIGRAHV